jgi:hypothetical protein
MSGESFTIVRGCYTIFAGSSTGEPIEAPTELDLYDWLRARGFSDTAVRDIIRKVNFSGRQVITAP